MDRNAGAEDQMKKYFQSVFKYGIGVGLIIFVLIGAGFIYVVYQVGRGIHENNQEDFGHPESPAPELTPTGMPGRILSKNHIWSPPPVARG